jgi:uncharacterized membrane protein
MSAMRSFATSLPAINVSQAERVGSIAGGGALMCAGLARRGLSGAVLLALGGLLIRRGATGHCAVYERLGITSVEPMAMRPGIKVERSITIRRPAAAIFEWVRDARNLPRFLNHLERVEVIDSTHSHWTARAEDGRRLEWDVAIINEHPNELIAWESLAGSPLPNAGSIRLKPLPGQEGTEVRIVLEMQPEERTGGSLLGRAPEAEVADDLARLKHIAEMEPGKPR